MDHKSQKRLFLCLLAIIGILLAEVIGGVMNSLALVSDVGHVWKCWHGSGGWGMGYQYYRM